MYKITRGLSRDEVNRLWAMLGEYRKELAKARPDRGGRRRAGTRWFFESVYYAFKTALRDRTSEIKSVDQLGGADRRGIPSGAGGGSADIPEGRGTATPRARTSRTTTGRARWRSSQLAAGGSRWFSSGAGSRAWLSSRRWWPSRT